jgi:hypothetical protein
VEASIEWRELGLRPTAIRDLWGRRPVEVSDGWQDVVAAHGSAVLRVW